MPRSLSELLLNKLHISSDRKKRWSPSPAWPLQDASLPRPTVSQQFQSALFRKLSPELRTLVYQHALGDPIRLMHILTTQDKDKKMCHNRCFEPLSEYPVWQHTCYLVKGGSNGSVIYSHTPGSQDKLLSPMLTCRAMYLEALPILYRSNIFALKGAVGLIKFQNSLLSAQWQALRQIYLSTQIITPFSYYKYFYDQFPPEGQDSWVRCCQLLQSLDHLYFLHFDIVIRDESELPYKHELYRREDWVYPGTAESLVAVLEPLKGLKARKYEVELNIPLSDNVTSMLGPVNFTILYNKKPRYTGVGGY